MVQFAEFHWQIMVKFIAGPDLCRFQGVTKDDIGLGKLHTCPRQISGISS